MVPHLRIENAFETCSSHLDRLDPTNLKDKELESFLVSALVLLIVSEYEEHIEAMFIERVKRCQDEQVVNYIKNVLSKNLEVQI